MIPGSRPKDRAVSPTKPIFKYVTHSSPEVPDRCVVCREPFSPPLSSAAGHKKRPHQSDDTETTTEKHAKLNDDDVLSVLLTGRGAQVEALWEETSGASTTSPTSTEGWPLTLPAVLGPAQIEVKKMGGWGFSKRIANFYPQNWYASDLSVKIID